LLEVTFFILYKRAKAMFDNILQDENREKNSRWINELDSLGVYTKSNSNELKDKQENRDLAEAIKQEFMEEYKQTVDT
jgi:hypothetical protein